MRTSSDGKRITGYAAVFKQLSDDLGGFQEMIIPGAFDRCLGSNPDVRCLFNHDPNIVLGRTLSGTLRLSADHVGLQFDCDLPNTQAARDLRESIRRGDISQCSFSFSVNGQNWREEGKDAAGLPKTIRELTDVTLFDVSPVTYAAYPQTSVSARLLWPEGEPAEVRSHKTDKPKTVKPQPASGRASSASPSSAPMSDAEWLGLIQKVNKQLGVPVLRKGSLAQNSNLEEVFMRNHRTLSSSEEAEIRRFLVTGRFEQRDLTTSAPASVFVPEAWNELVWQGMKAYDALYDPAFSTPITTDTGSPYDLFAIDDTQAAATLQGEPVPATEQDPNSLAKVQLASAPTYDSGMVTVSINLLMDSAVNVPEMLAQAFAVRLARGISPALITALLDSASLGSTATGDQNSGSPSGATQVGYQDLIALRKSVNPAYRASGKCSWLMNDDSLSALDSLTDKNGRPILHPIYNADGQRLLLGYPVGICPSLPDIGESATPIFFGALGYFVVRSVKGAGRLLRLTEAVGTAEKLMVGFKSFARVNGALLAAQAGSPQGVLSPVKYLQNAA
jgi:hypothetical protein